VASLIGSHREPRLSQTLRDFVEKNQKHVHLKLEKDNYRSVVRRKGRSDE